MKSELGQLEFVEPDWPAPKNIRALTSTRLGGSSRPPFDSLNLGAHVNDDPTAVHRNRALLSSTLDLPSEPVWLEQVHGAKIVELIGDAPDSIVADGTITQVDGVVCCIMTADCLPLLLCDRDGTQVAAVHVGWRGLAAGIVEKAISLFNAPPSQLLAWAGPAISIQHFEVGGEVKSQLGGIETAWRASQNKEKYFADLNGLVGQRAQSAGVGWYGYSDHCTYADEKRFFSHRRDGESGRLASIIYKI